MGRWRARRGSAPGPALAGCAGVRAPVALAFGAALALALGGCGPSGPPDGAPPDAGGATAVGSPTGGAAAGADGGTVSSAGGGTPAAGDSGGGPSPGGSDDGGPSTGGGATAGGGPPSGGAGPSDGGSPAGPGTPAASGGAPAPPAGGGGAVGASVFAHKMGGLGVEWTQDVAVAPDGTIVAFNLIGVRGESLEQIGFVHLDRDGNELASQFENEQGAGLHLAPWGAFAIAASGDMIVAASPRCAGATCPTLGGAAVPRAAVVRLSAQARPIWSAELAGDVLSNVDVDPSGAVLVAFRSGGAAALRKLGADGQVAWEVPGLELAPGTPVALTPDGEALYARGGTVTGLSAAGAPAWTQAFRGDLTFTVLRSTPTGFLALGSYRGRISLGETALAAPAGSDHGWFLAGFDAGGAVRWARDLGVVQETSDAGVKALLSVDAAGAPVVVTGADACTAAVAAFDAGGQPRWRRSLAVNGCGGHDLVVHGVAAGPTGRIVLGGAISGPADLGTGPLTPLATDGFVVGLAP